jgi:beta-glucosidase
LNAYRVERPLEFLKAKTKVVYAPAYDQEKVTRKSTEEALLAASKAKVVLFFTGTTASMESEGSDRTSIDLPHQHLALLKKIHKINSNIIVILNNGAAVDLREVQPYCKAIVEAWLLGSASGQPLVDILFGDHNPSGKLSETFPLQLEHTPAYGNFPGLGDEIVYSEGLLSGYRHYDTRQLKVMYPFGYGLSYTSFKLSDPVLSQTKITKDETLTLSVILKNTGKRKGQQVVQVYLKDLESYLPRPLKELRAFKKVELEAGESQKISFTLSERDFAYYVPHLGRFAVESGLFEACIGFSCEEILCSVKFEVNSDDKVRPHLSLDYPYNRWISYPYENTQVKKLVEMTRNPFWWETEPPLRRWLKVLKLEFNWSDSKLEEVKAMLMEEE